MYVVSVIRRLYTKNQAEDTVVTGGQDWQL